MSDLIYSPVEVKDKILDKFPDLSFFQPYIDGTFDNNPNKGHIVVGVRTPWYDLVYLDIKAGGFWDKYINEPGMKNILREVVAELDAALTIQLEFGTNGPIRIDREELSKYRNDPKGYIQDRRKLEKPASIVSVEKTEEEAIFEEDEEKLSANYTYDVYVEHNSKLNIDSILGARKINFLCGCKKCVDKMRAVHKLHPLYLSNKSGMDGVTLIVDHDNSLNSTEEEMVNAEHLTFLCTCKKCKKEFYRIRDIRIKKAKEKNDQKA